MRLNGCIRFLSQSFWEYHEHPYAHTNFGMCHFYIFQTKQQKNKNKNKINKLIKTKKEWIDIHIYVLNIKKDQNHDDTVLVL